MAKELSSRYKTEVTGRDTIIHSCGGHSLILQVVEWSDYSIRTSVAQVLFSEISLRAF